MSDLELQSPAFRHQAPIPARHTCDGQNLSPPLAWKAGPKGTACYALICQDPDAPAGLWTHWVAWNIPSTALGEGIGSDARLDGGMCQGLNSWGDVGYRGPCPPSGSHRYFFRVYALDRALELPPSTDAEGLESATKGHVVAEGELMGRFARATSGLPAASKSRGD